LSAEVGCSKKPKENWQWHYEIALRKRGQGAEPVRLSSLKGLDFDGMARSGKPLSVTSYHFFKPAIMFSGMKATRLDYLCRLSVRRRTGKR
ncbi:MAG: hypothetical protein KJO07_13505, partial [Deltaproteobacteria bacterium]|nr:hypothetical protein [Deltaproteobacteria bacterium]